MISKHLTILPAVVALLLTTACSNDDMDGTLADGLVAAQVTADISDGQSATRVSTDNDGASFTEGDEIHVVASETTYDYTKQSDGAWSATTPYYFQNSEEVSFLGWYADPALTLEGNSISINTTSQETNANGWNEWDILATPVVTTDVSSPTVNFTSTNNAAFQHVMSQATITFKAGDDIDDLTALTEYTLSSLTTDATFDTQTCALTKGNTTGSITQTVADASGTEVSSTIILVPQDVTDNLLLEVTYNGQTYTTDLALPDNATTLAEGTHYAFNVTIANTGLTVNSAEIKSWSTMTAETSSASLKGYYITTDADGTETYVVFGEAGLLAWAEYTRSGNWGTNCTLIKDITLSTVAEGKSNWTAVGSDHSSSQYTGTFDGNGYTISNLTISASSDYQGLIGYLGSGGVVKNLTMADVNITTTYNRAGAVVGRNYYGTVTNCFTLGSVSGNWYTSGVVGDNYYGTVTNCNSSCTVKGSAYIGGVVGRNYHGTVTACYSTGSVIGSNGTGGVVGWNYGTITACYSTGSVSATSYTGGVVGYDNDGTVTACYWNNDATYGIGDPESNDGATYVDGTIEAWASAAETMNTTLTEGGYSWKYVVNDAYTETSSTVAPLLLEDVTE